MVKIGIDIPKTMIEISQKPDAKARPYDLCLECPFMNKTCDGPNILAMESERWIEWANQRAKQLGLSRNKISELSGIPLSTIKSVMTGKTQDMRHSTMRDITKVLIGGCWGQYPCHFAALLLDGKPLEEDSEMDNAVLKASTAKDQQIIEFLKGQVAFKETQMSAKDKTIADLTNSYKLYRRIMFALIAFVVALFIADLFIGSVGWFRF